MESLGPIVFLILGVCVLAIVHLATRVRKIENQKTAIHRTRNNTGCYSPQPVRAWKYNLSTPFEITTASFCGEMDVYEDLGPHGMKFEQNGKYLIVATR